MKTLIRARASRFLGVVLALFLSTAACSLPLGPVNNQPTATVTAGVPTVSLPTATLPAATLPAATLPAATLPAPTQPPAPTATRPAPVVPTNTRPPAQLSEVTIYFIAVGDDGLSGPKVGCGDSLVAVKQPIEPTSGVIRASLNKLFSFKQQNIGESGLYTALWQSDLSLANARVDDGVATVSLTGTVMMGGECDIPRFKAQIEQTILAQPGVKQAIVFLNDQPIDQALSLK